MPVEVVGSRPGDAAGLKLLRSVFMKGLAAAASRRSSTFKALSSAKSLKDAFDLQTRFARSTMEKTVAESGKLTDASMKLTEQTLAPLTARVSLAMEKFAKSA